MKVTFICHSCFLVETAECYYLFDYYKGKLPSLDTEKPLLVFVSHSHQDHYNPAVFAMLRQMGMKKVGAIFPNDIKPKNYPEGWALLKEDEVTADNGTTSGNGGISFDNKKSERISLQADVLPADHCSSMDVLEGHIFKVYHSREYDLPCRTHIRTLLSTDSGVAYLLICPEGIFYHAGDLNDWITEDTPDTERRQMSGSFRAALRPLKDISIDYACLPLDPHLGCHYADGFLYFLQHIGAGKVYPMHFWDKPEIADRFLREHPEYQEIVVNIKDLFLEESACRFFRE